jgi:hypothetical protein
VRALFRPGFAALAALAFAVLAACEDDASTAEATFPADGGSGHLAADARTVEAAAAGGAIATMRLAHLAPGLGPIDFCYQAAREGSLVGPVLGGGARSAPDAGDGGGAEEDAGSGLEPVPDGDGGRDAAPAIRRSASYRQVTKYLNLAAAGPLRIAIVEAGAGSCAQPLASGEATLDPGELSTVAVFARGAADGGLAVELGVFTDDRSPAPEGVRVRVVHAALGRPPSAVAAGTLAVRAVASRTLVLADRVEPKKSASASDAVAVDALGYATGAPLPGPAAITIGPASTDAGADAGFSPWSSASADLGLTAGSVHTGFVLSGGKPAWFEVLWCADLVTDGEVTACELVR